METVNKKVILISLFLAVLTTAMVFLYVKKATTKAEVIEYVNVYVAAKTMPEKYLIKEQDIRQFKVTKEYVGKNAVMNAADIIGKRLKDRIIEGEQILLDRLVSDENVTLSFNIPKGKRAISVNVSEQTQVANLLRPGDMVDVIGNFPEKDQTNPDITKIILQNIQVLALGQKTNLSEEEKNELPKTVTLAVLPQEAEKLSFAAQFGTITLALRGVEDGEKSNSNGVIRNLLINSLQ